MVDFGLQFPELVHQTKQIGVSGWVQVRHIQCLQHNSDFLLDRYPHLQGAITTEL